MTVRAVVEPDELLVEIEGWFDRLMCLSSGLRVPRAAITGARTTGWDEARAGMGWRVGGAYWPGRIATGWYTAPAEKGSRQFWAVFRDRDVLLVVDTSLPRPARLVLAVPDATSVAERLASG